MRYFFHTEDGECLPDKSGIVLDGVEDAKVEAVRRLAQLVLDDPDMFWDTGSLRITATDETGMTLFLLDLSAVLASAFPLSAMPKGGRPDPSEA